MILLVDDDPGLRSLISMLLEEEGFTVKSAQHGLAALQLLEEGLAPELVLLDMRMPVMDGEQFAAALRERGMRYPTLVMTAARDAQLAGELVGADGAVAKPFDVDEFIAMIRAILPKDPGAITPQAGDV